MNIRNFADSSFSPVKWFKVCGIVSLILVCIGLFAFIGAAAGLRTFNFDIEFVGGVSSEYNLHTDATTSVISDVDGIVNSVTGSHASSIQATGDNNQSVLIKTLEIDSQTRDSLLSAIQEKYPDAEFVSTSFISSSVGADLRAAAIKASLLAILLILVYITIRFEIRSGLAAIMALTHDICIMMAFFFIFQLPVNMNFIAAALTILGYSINATIVIFDRVRENSKGITDNKIFADIVDRSIRQTMSRSVNSSLTTVIPVILILVLGVPSIQNFAIALIVGITSGTYSSVMLAGPIWVMLRKGGKKGKSTAVQKAKKA
jgi:preprotein translocase SecF subunit